MIPKRAALAVAVFASVVQPAWADTHTLSFDFLAPMVGQIVNSVTEDGFTITGDSGFGFEVVQTAGGVYPWYVSLAPIGNWTVTDDTNQRIYSASKPAISLMLGGPLIDQPYNLQVTGYLAGVTQWKTSLPGEMLLEPAISCVDNALAPVDSFNVHNLLQGQPYQITEIVIESVPEPSSAVLAAIGLVVVGFWSRQRHEGC